MEDLQTYPVIFETTEDENEPEQKLTHWIHPTDSTSRWCGSPRTPGFGNGRLADPRKQKSCSICNDLMRRFGAAWWWDTHCRHYESRCHIHDGYGFHDCAGARTQ